MPVQEFALDSTGMSRVQIFHEGSGAGCTVLVNRSIIGSVSTKEELMEGREFRLKDGSVLTVLRVNKEYHVMREGQALSPMSAIDIAAAEAVAEAVAVAVAVAEARVAIVKAEAEARVATVKARAVAKAEAAKARAVAKEKVMLLREADPLKFILQKSQGAIIAGIGSLVSLLAFFTMPYFAAHGGFFSTASATGQQLASGIALFTQYNNQISWFQLLWLEPLVAVIVLVSAGVQLFKSLNYDDEVAKRIATGLIGLSALAIVVLLCGYVLDSQSAPGSSFTFASLYASGFWIFIVGMIIAIAGGLVATRGSGALLLYKKLVMKR